MGCFFIFCCCVGLNEKKVGVGGGGGLEGGVNSSAPMKIQIVWDVTVSRFVVASRLSEPYVYRELLR